MENEFDDSSASLDLSGTVDLDEIDDEPEKKPTRSGLLDKIKIYSTSEEVDRQQMAFLQSEVTRALRMFILHMKMKGHFKEFKEDYFA